MIEINQSAICNIINQVHSIENKCKELDSSGKMNRRFDRIKAQWESMNIYVHSPLDEKYDETRLDCDATIAGEKTNNLHVVEVIKPIILLKEGERKSIIQNGIVIVEGE